MSDFFHRWLGYPRHEKVLTLGIAALTIALGIIEIMILSNW